MCRVSVIIPRESRNCGGDDASSASPVQGPPVFMLPLEDVARNIRMAATRPVAWSKIQEWIKCTMAALRQQDEEKKQAIQDFVQTQLHRRDAWGNTLLCLVVYFGPPSKVVRELLRLAQMVSMEDYCLLSNDGHATPLHIACASGASLAVLYTLLESSPLAKRAIFLQDRNDKAPLAALMSRYDMLSKLPLSRCEDESQVRHHDSRTALKRFRHLGQLKLPDPLSHQDHDSVTSVFWQTVELMLRTAWNSDDVETKDTRSLRSSTDFTLAAGAAYASSAVPERLAQAIMQSSGKECHKAVLEMALASDSLSRPKRKSELRRREYFARSVLLQDRQNVEDLNGRKLLQCALQSGYSWHSVDGSEQGIIALLLEKFPTADAGWTPLASAAMQRHEVSDDSCLDTVYELLRRNPAQLM